MTPWPAHTCSMVAFDPEHNRLGMAVQSHCSSGGRLVPWAEAGLGAVANPRRAVTSRSIIAT